MKDHLCVDNIKNAGEEKFMNTMMLALKRTGERIKSETFYGTFCGCGQ